MGAGGGARVDAVPGLEKRAWHTFMIQGAECHSFALPRRGDCCLGRHLVLVVENHVGSRWANGRHVNIVPRSNSWRGAFSWFGGGFFQSFCLMIAATRLYGTFCWRLKAREALSGKWTGCYRISCFPFWQQISTINCPCSFHESVIALPICWVLSGSGGAREEIKALDQ